MKITNVEAVELKFLTQLGYWIVKGEWKHEKTLCPTFLEFLFCLTPKTEPVTTEVYIALNQKTGNLYWSPERHQPMMDLDQCKRAYALIQDGNVKQRVPL